MGDIISFEAHREAARLKAIRNDLPKTASLRWVARRKAAVVSAIECGAISLEEAQERYALSEEELRGWRESISAFRQSDAARRVLAHYRNTHEA